MGFNNKFSKWKENKNIKYSLTKDNNFELDIPNKFSTQILYKDNILVIPFGDDVINIDWICFNI